MDVDAAVQIYLERNVITGGRKEAWDLEARNTGAKWRAKIFLTNGIVNEAFPGRLEPSMHRYVKHAPFPMSMEVLKDAAQRWDSEYRCAALLHPSWSASALLTVSELSCCLHVGSLLECRLTASSKHRTYRTIDIPTLHNMHCQVCECTPASCYCCWAAHSFPVVFRFSASAWCRLKQLWTRMLR